MLPLRSDNVFGSLNSRSVCAASALAQFTVWGRPLVVGSMPVIRCEDASYGNKCEILHIADTSRRASLYSYYMYSTTCILFYMCILEAAVGVLVLLVCVSG